MRSTAGFALTSLLVLAACSDIPIPPTGPAASLQPSFAAAAGNDTPVKSELLGGGGNPDNSIEGDGLGAYANGVNGVSSILQSPTGDWVLDQTAAKSTRKTRIDLSDALAGNPLPAPFTTAIGKVRFIAKAASINSGSFPTMTGLGSTMLTPLAVGQISYGGKTYAVRMNSSTHPGTDWVKITCIGVVDPTNPATSPCSKWELTPTGNYGGVTKNVGYLEAVATTNTFIGYYYFTFDIVITK